MSPSSLLSLTNELPTIDQFNEDTLGSLFESSFQEATERFKVAAQNASAQIIERNVYDGNSIVFAQLGSSTAERALIHIAGTHGVEYFFGGAVQLKLMEAIPIVAPNTTLIFIHGVNPFGAAESRRVNESNVDLNRNFIKPDLFSSLIQVNAPLSSINFSPSTREEFLHTSQIIKSCGTQSLIESIKIAAVGQYSDPKAMFYGGAEMEASTHLIAEVLKELLPNVKHIRLIDAHTGLGARGQETLIPAVPEMLQRQPRLAQNMGFDISQSTAVVPHALVAKGTMALGIAELFPNADVFGIAQEIGTCPLEVVQEALVRENFITHFGDSHGYNEADLNTARKDLRAAFIPNQKEWQAQTLNNGLQLTAKLFS